MNTTLMNKDIFTDRTSFRGSDESVTFFIGEPFDTSLYLGHGC